MRATFDERDVEALGIPRSTEIDMDQLLNDLTTDQIEDFEESSGIYFTELEAKISNPSGLSMKYLKACLWLTLRVSGVSIKYSDFNLHVAGLEIKDVKTPKDHKPPKSAGASGKK